jgi:hypothetical protein
MHLKRSAAYYIMSYSDIPHMTTSFVVTPHPGGLDYDLDETSNYPSKTDKVLMSTADTGNLFGKIWMAQKQGLPMVNTFH